MRYFTVWEYGEFGLTTSIKMILYIYSVYVFVVLPEKRKNKLEPLTEDIIARYIYYWGVVDSIIPSVFLMNPELYFSVIEYLDINMSEHVTNSRFAGIKFTDLSIGGGTLSLVYMIAGVCGLSLVSSGKLNNSIFFSGSIILLAGMMLSGRIGLIIYMMMFIVFFFKAQFNIMQFNRRGI